MKPEGTRILVDTKKLKRFYNRQILCVFIYDAQMNDTFKCMTYAVLVFSVMALFSHASLLSLTK
jgi:hypothetical protein